MAGFRPDKRGPEPKIADKRSATGRAGSGSICPRRILAQWMRISTHAPRGAPLPLVCDVRVEARARFPAGIAQDTLQREVAEPFSR